MPKDSLSPPADAVQRRSAKPVVCYRVEQLPDAELAQLERAREHLKLIEQIKVQPRDAAAFVVPAGYFFRIISVEGPQVGDLNLWHTDNLQEHFFSGKTRQLHATHVTTGDRLWSNFPFLRPMATITYDSLSWYGYDKDGAGVHDVIGTRCDPYTNQLLHDVDYHYCCHSNISRAIAKYLGILPREAEAHVHDVLNVFMCTGFTADTHQYFMKASPVRPGDYIEFFAEINLLAALSTCPGGDCGSTHSDDKTQCHPLLVEIYQSTAKDSMRDRLPPAKSSYDRTHGV